MRMPFQFQQRVSSSRGISSHTSGRSVDVDQATSAATTPNAPLEASQRRFLAALSELRPRLHRYCARMSGSALDGEDLVQETLAQAFDALATLKDQSRFEAWLFRIAHNKCLDFIRRARRSGEEFVSYEDEHGLGRVEDPDERAEPLDDALARLVTMLPPMERACVLLKDVLDYRLAEIADIVDSTIGGVKSALHRGRLKLRQHDPAPGLELDPAQRTLLEEYVDRFNRRDWEALRELIRADARVEVVGVAEFRELAPDAPYFRNYSALRVEWKLDLARVDGEPVIVQWRKAGVEWVPFAPIRLFWENGRVVRIRDYFHVDYLLAGAAIS